MYPCTRGPETFFIVDYFLFYPLADEERVCLRPRKLFFLLIIFYFILRRTGKELLKATALPRIFIHAVCRFNSIIFALQRYLAYPSAPVASAARAVPASDHCYYFSSTSCRCIRVREYALLLVPPMVLPLPIIASSEARCFVAAPSPPHCLLPPVGGPPPFTKRRGTSPPCHKGGTPLLRPGAKAPLLPARHEFLNPRPLPQGEYLHSCHNGGGGGLWQGGWSPGGGLPNPEAGLPDCVSEAVILSWAARSDNTPRSNVTTASAPQYCLNSCGGMKGHRNETSGATIENLPKHRPIKSQLRLGNPFLRSFIGR